MQQLKRIFNNREEFKLALKTLLDRGYQYDELKINHREGLDNEEEDMVQFQNSGNTTLRKSLTGFKWGIVSGAVITGGIVGLILLFSESGTSLSPIATLITALSVGAVWGGVLGFMLGSLFPLNAHDNSRKNADPKNFSIHFLPHNEEDEHYFKEEWQTAY
ncbi:hypothetical protein SAMN00777080_2434 [Aquiflexum balticum DSM 16537]|uniref:Uncharacterized protein n=1 Tax=Aquiflexum balticum DSM 16537 TaxID=758820 RepID=A0A1W2H4X8_9BACT|nr:hypothetical protein [Aquiflexum balticum]SMD43824.1 hypothetical protein SAMN00777080_2434 [Aquiflexum balticum DSM 16537]